MNDFVKKIIIYPRSQEENYVCDIQGELDRKEEKIQQLESTIKQISMSPKPSRTASAASSSVMGDRSSGAALQVMRSRNDGLMALNRSLEQRLQECEDDRNFLGKTNVE